MNLANNEIHLAVELTICEWLLQNRIMYGLLNKLTEAELEHSELPNGQNALCLLAHVISSTDLLFYRLGAGSSIYPELSTILEDHDITTESLKRMKLGMKECFLDVNEKLLEIFQSMGTDDWLEPLKQLDSETDNEAHNRLQLLLRHIGHQSFHTGQLNLLL